MKRIILENFQGHEKTVIKPAKGMTAITGKSDHGKSSLIRGIKWVRDNKPNGTAFIRLGSKEAKVTIDNVTHTRTAKTNKYFIKGKKDPFKALRGAVPEEITEALNLGEENIQNQHGKPFLLDDSPGKVAQQLSSLVDLEAPTRALKFLASKKRQHNSNADALNSSIEVTEKQLSDLEHVAQADLDLHELEADEVHIERLRAKWYTLDSAIKRAVKAKQELSEIPSIDALEPAKQLAKHHNELQVMIGEHHILEQTANEIVSLEHLLKFNPKKLLGKAKRLKKLKIRRNKLAVALNRANKFEEKASDLFVKEIDLKHKKEDMLAGECPMCGRS